MRIFLVYLGCLMLITSCQEKNGSTGSESIFDLTVSNSGPDSVRYGLDLDLIRIDQDFKLMQGDKEFPIQIEDRNNNGTPDKLFTLVDIPARRKITLSAFPGTPTEGSVGIAVHASLVNGGAISEPYTYERDDKWEGRGIIVENKWAAYRMLMQPPFAYDIIGKRLPKMIEDPNTVDAVHSWGGAILDAGQSLGIGSPAIYDLEKIVDLSIFDSKVVEVVASGPLRAEIHTTIKGIPVRDEKIDVLIKWSMEAEAHWAQIDFSILSKTDLTLQLACGLPRNEDATDFTQGLTSNVHFAYTYGTQSSAGEFLSMAIMVPGKYETDTFRDDEFNHFYLVDPVEKAIQYRIVSAWGSGQLNITDEVVFTDLVKECAKAYAAPITVKTDFKLR